MTERDDARSFRQAVRGERFAIGAEVVTTRGLGKPRPPATVIGRARELLDDTDERIDWISVTENPGGVPALPPDWLAGAIAQPAIRNQADRVVLHLTCKDVNRNAQEAAAWRYAVEGFKNLLALTGDYPTTGFLGTADPVFDLDSVSLIHLLTSMNRGLVVPGRGTKRRRLARTEFFVGCTVSPFKRHEREILPQYFKLLGKIRAGAEWVIPQLGYDMRKFHEIKLFLAARGMSDIPIVGNAYVLGRVVARLFNQNRLAGCVVSDALLEQIERYSAGPDKGRDFFHELAAKQLAVFRGLGFAAGYIGGIHQVESFFDIVDRSRRFAEDDWKDFMREIQFSLPEEFFLFDHDPETGLCAEGRFNPDFIKSIAKPRRSREVTLGYRLSRRVHDWAFTRDKGLWGWMRRFFGWLDRKPNGLAHRFVYWVERMAKRVGYGCEDCGDCSLPECAYLCPKAGCSKHARNGPCGGSADGRCELDDKECFWTRVYQRQKYFGESETMLDRPVVVYNAELKHTSSWVNTYLDRNHDAPAAGEADVEPNEE